MTCQTLHPKRGGITPAIRRLLALPRRLLPLIRQEPVFEQKTPSSSAPDQQLLHDLRRPMTLSDFHPAKHAVTVSHALRFA
jgi:hypothetical protein